MTDVAVFLVKNGIGFGHIRRALTVSAAVAEAGQLQPVVISQAGSLALHQLRHPKVSIVNFPLLHRVPSAVTEDCYTDLLDSTLRHLDPVVVVEDTYPDPRYGALPSLRDVPRLLVLRRLDGQSFDQIRRRSGFARYEQILLAQDPASLTKEGHSGESLAAIHHSGRFTIVGDLISTHSPADVDTARRRYTPDGERLVVVAAGAGGDQMPDGYADRLFTACRRIADLLTEERPEVRFVLVTGPYYAGRTIPPGGNVVVRRFEPNLAALLGAADVAVIKPSNNSLGETLHGSAQLVLVPDVSFMEGVDQHANWVVANYGGVVTQPEPDRLERHIRHALDQPPRRRRPAPNPTGITRIVDAVHEHARRSRHPATVTPKRLILVVQPSEWCAPDKLRTLLPEPLRTSAAIVGASAEQTSPHVVPLSTLAAGHPARATAGGRGVLVDIDPPGSLTPTDLAQRSLTFLLTRAGAHQEATARWLRLHPSTPCLLTADLAHVRATPGNGHRLTRRISNLLNQGPSAALLLDLAPIGQQVELMTYLHEFTQWLHDQPVLTVTLDHLHQTVARSLLEPP
jgi:predicted glycosyltransferase